jgi:membrane fusion protein, heavy metal efflux system
MNTFRKLLPYAVSILILGGLVVVGFLTRDYWQGWLLPGKPPEEEKPHAHETPGRVRLSPQARANLRLAVKPATVEPYWRMIQVPGVIVERPDNTDRAIVAPITGVVTRINLMPGKTVRAGDELFSLRLTSESVQTTQGQLFKTAQELQINQDDQARLKAAQGNNSLFNAKLIELGYEQRRLNAALETYRQDLLARGIKANQIDAIQRGDFLTEMKINAPSPSTETSNGERLLLSEVEEIKVKRGEQVQAGQTLCLLANHQQLLIEGRGYEEDTKYLERAAEKGWKVRAEFVEQAVASGPSLSEPLTISYLGNRVDPANRTFPFYIPLANQLRVEVGPTVEAARRWRFRPGERVMLHVPVEQFIGQIVVPLGAVVREGPEAYVFRANGDVFDRKPVNVLFEDEHHAVIANDGSIAEGNLIAQNNAAHLNRVLKAKEAGHDHHGHSH